MTGMRVLEVRDIRPDGPDRWYEMDCAVRRWGRCCVMTYRRNHWQDTYDHWHTTWSTPEGKSVKEAESKRLSRLYDFHHAHQAYEQKLLLGEVPV